jgi:hypothetical protein
MPSDVATCFAIADLAIPGGPQTNVDTLVRIMVRSDAATSEGFNVSVSTFDFDDLVADIGVAL